MRNLGTATLDKAVTVKLTRTLAIIPITLGLSGYYGKKGTAAGQKFQVKKAVPVFVLYFVLASLVTTALPSSELRPHTVISQVPGSRPCMTMGLPIRLTCGARDALPAPLCLQ
jgi:uncharacterized membrane protein YadS